MLHHPSLSLLEIEREREERLSRILTMERELALLRSREDSASRRPQPQTEAAYDRYDRYEAYRRERSPPRRELDYPPPRDYPRNDRMGYEGGRGDERGRSYYNGRSDSPGTREGPGSAGGSGEAYRNPVSYPIQGRGGYDRRDNSSQYSSGGGMGYGSRGGGGGGGMGQSSNPSVGYGSSGGKLGMGGAPPPGWPSSDYDKSNANRPPFASAAPWN